MTYRFIEDLKQEGAWPVSGGAGDLNDRSAGAKACEHKAAHISEDHVRVCGLMDIAVTSAESDLELSLLLLICDRDIVSAVGSEQTLV